MQNTELIKNLSLEQKIAIVCDVAALGTLPEELGIPQMKFAQADGGGLPSYAAIACTWNEVLMEKAFSWQAQRLKEEGAKAVLVENAGVKSNPLAPSTSEDPYFASSVIAAFSRGVEKQGLTSCVRGGFSEGDLVFMDEKFSERAFYEYSMAAYSRSEASAYVFPYRKLRGSYERVNIDKVSGFFKKEAQGRNGYVLCSDCPAEHTLTALADGYLLLGASPEKVRKAVNKFLAMQGKVERGEMDGATLDDAIEKGEAISVSRLDELADRVVSFALSTQREVDYVEERGADISWTATLQSIVLMKNDGVLPVNGAKEITIIGSDEEGSLADGLAQSLTNSYKQGQVRSLVGYSLKEERSDEKIAECIQAAQGSDFVVVLLDCRKKGGRYAYKLPASELALLDKVKSLGCPTVGVLLGDRTVDVGFDEGLKGLLLSPSVSEYSAEALASVLLGKASPSGKLVNTYYADTEGYCKELVSGIRNGYTKVGAFAGYRAHDGEGAYVRYPFGHGLSYSKFTYSNLVVQGENLSFTVTNTGNCNAAEVVQIYVGKADSAIVRPKKQLKGYAKVTLKPGESKVIRVGLKAGSFAVYHKGKFVVERGKYEIYVGSSLRDIRLQGAIQTAGDLLYTDGEKLSDYLQSQSNLLSGGYTLSKVQKKASAGKKARVVGGSIAATSLTLGLIVLLLEMTGMLLAIETSIFAGVILSLVALFIGGLVTLLIGVIMGKVANGKQEILSTGNAHQEQERQTEQSFRSLFDSLYLEEEQEEQVEETTEKQEQIQVVQEEFVGEYDPSLLFEEVCSRLALFITERGIVCDKTMAAKLLSALSSSRIWLLRANDKGLANKLLQAVSEFLGGSVDRWIATGASSLGEILYTKEGGYTPVGTAIDRCGNDRDVSRFVALDFENIEDASKIFTPLLRFIDRRVQCELSVYHNGKTQKRTLYPNLWFVLCADESQKITSANGAFADACCTLYLQLEECEEKTEKTFVPYFNYYQFMKMEGTALRFDGKYAERYLPDEEKFWKKLDRIERYLAGNTAYAFTSKQSASIERFATVFLACGCEQEYVLDNVVAAKLAVTAVGMATEDVLGEGGLVAHLDAIFGDSVMDETKRLINSCAIVAETV